jgi:hypothetical protein
MKRKMMKVSFDWLKRFFSNKRELKLISLALGILSFYAIRAATSDEITYDLPVEVKVEEEGIAILEQEPSSVKVTFRGSPEDILRLAQQKHIEEAKAVIRPKAKDPRGAEKVAVTPRNISGAGRGVRVVNIDPQFVVVTFDREVEKEFLVTEPEILGKPLRGKVEVSYEPKTVRIQGPKRRLEAAKNVVDTEPINVGGRVESFSKEVRVIAPITWVSEIKPQTVDVRINIVTESISRKWEDMDILAMTPQGSEARYRFRPPTVDVTVHGRKKLVNRLSADQLSVFADCTRLDLSKTNMVEVNVHLPEGTDVHATPEPGRVRVTAEKGKHTSVTGAETNRNEKTGDN